MNLMSEPVLHRSLDNSPDTNILSQLQHEQSKDSNYQSKLQTTQDSLYPIMSSSANKPPLHRSRRNIAKIIKGEIHNVVTVMRSDPRYYTTSPITASPADRGRGGQWYDDKGHGGRRSRFEYEERQQLSGVGMTRFWSSRGDNLPADATNIRRNKRIMQRKLDEVSSDVSWFAAHPILQGLRDLHDRLSAMEESLDGLLEWRQIEADDVAEDDEEKDETFSTRAGTSFISPFAAAVCSRDVDAKTTAAALAALHKFIVYGFIGGHYDRNWSYNHHQQPAEDYYSDAIWLSLEDIRESITLVAQCIRKCSFEESSQINSATNSSNGLLSFWSSEEKKRNNDVASILNQTDGNSSPNRETTASKLPDFLLRPRRTKSSNMNRGTSNSNNMTPPLSMSSEGENVVLKLLSLSVQVLRCPAGRNYLSSSDIVGIFDTCLHVALVAGESKRPLLRSAAGDALSHCVIVVFGMRERHTAMDDMPYSIVKNILKDDDTVDPTNSGDESDIDDDWGERDPTEEDATNYALRAEKFVVKEQEHKQHSSKVTSNRQDTMGDDLSKVEKEPALVAIMARLAAISDPLIQEDDTCILSLSLINIALETMSDVDALAAKHPRLLNIMQNDLCRNLLRLSTSSDVTLLGLALRVIFNLFNGIKDHLKVQLEVFLTSVHLRILSSSVSPSTHERVWSSSPEHRELALESLLEFCREPMLMMDLYLNYDCDINCTNLFETICITLSKVANPEVVCSESTDKEYHERQADGDDELPEQWKAPHLNILNRLALEGIIAVIDSIYRRCRSSTVFPRSTSNTLTKKHNAPIIEYSTGLSPPDSGNSAILGNILHIENGSYVDASGSIRDYQEYDFCNLSLSSDSITPNKYNSAHLRTKSDLSEHDFDSLSMARNRNSLALHERKNRKRLLAKTATVFNECSRDKEWIAEAERLGVLPSPATPKSVAIFLHSTSKLDKAKIGAYISKGPKDKYPFNEKVLQEFVRFFDFYGLSFSESLRLFLSRFRLPGEAQCIDRLMEAFAARLFEAQRCNRISNKNVENTMLDPPRIEGYETNSRCGILDPPTSDDKFNHVLPFRSADAAYILSFSTIMLNTDLHNPSLKDEKRMTLEQFIRNNKGINDGADLPVEFITDLYNEIKSNQIQMKKDFINDGSMHCGDFQFDGLLKGANDVAAPFFTSAHSIDSAFIQAGVHDRDMFVSISSATIKAISTVFVHSWDDALVMKALVGLRNSADLCFYFGLYRQFNEILEMLLSWGQDYIRSVATLMYSEPEAAPRDEKNMRLTKELENNQEMDDLTHEADFLSHGIPALPLAFTTTMISDNTQRKLGHVSKKFIGSAAHRGLLSLHCALMLTKNCLSAVDESLPLFIDTIFALREIDALPTRLSDLDDFADSHGNPLPVSSFANNSWSRVTKYRKSMSTSAKSSSSTAAFLSTFGLGLLTKKVDKNTRSPSKCFNPLTKMLQLICKKASLDHIIMKMNDVAMAKRILSSMLEAVVPIFDDSEIITNVMYEHNSVFVLELAARLIISNRSHSAELLPIFMSKLDLFFSERDPSDSCILGLTFPYVLERIIVTILRTCIHLYDIPEESLRLRLKHSLDKISKLPCSYTQEISDRLGCGAAIILRGCFFLFQGGEEWSTMKDLLDQAAQHQAGRMFVFDGIASLIDYTLPVGNDGKLLMTDGIVELSKDGAEAMASLLLKFLDGSYDNDISYRVPSMMYVKRIYLRLSQCVEERSAQSVEISESSEDEIERQGVMWEKVVKVIYNDMCLSQDGMTAKEGFESLHEIIFDTKVETISDTKWIALLEMLSNHPPSITLQFSRISALSLIGRLMLTLMPGISSKKEHWSQLEEITIEVAKVIGENLRSGRSTPLFETTVHTVTNLSNVMSISKCSDVQKVHFCTWVAETLMFELEKVGACGGVTSMITAAYRNNGINLEVLSDHQNHQY